MFLKNLCLWVMIFSALTIGAQVLRFDPKGSSIGVQTPHEWSIYAHTAGSVGSILPGVSAWNNTTQLGYVWYKGDRGGIRSSAQITYWGIFDDIYYFYELIPIGVSLYPFEKDYLGVDLELSVPPTFPETRINATFLVRF